MIVSFHHLSFVAQELKKTESEIVLSFYWSIILVLQRSSSVSHLNNCLAADNLQDLATPLGAIWEGQMNNLSVPGELTHRGGLRFSTKDATTFQLKIPA